MTMNKILREGLVVLTIYFVVIIALFMSSDHLHRMEQNYTDVVAVEIDN